MQAVVLSCWTNSADRECNGFSFAHGFYSPLLLSGSLSLNPIILTSLRHQDLHYSTTSTTSIMADINMNDLAQQLKEINVKATEHQTHDPSPPKRRNGSATPRMKKPGQNANTPSSRPPSPRSTSQRSTYRGLQHKGTSSSIARFSWRMSRS
jgi:hypothetical protein